MKVEVSVIIRAKAEADNTYWDIDYLAYHKTESNKYTLFWRK